MRALLFGGGHIAQQLAPLLARLGLAVEVHDNRPVYATADKYPPATLLRIGEYQALASEAVLDEMSYCFIFTHGHSHDGVVLEGLLRRDETAPRPPYVGMIGSRRKIAEKLRELESGGIPRARLDEVFAPIGLNIGGDEPFEIAISICAEVQALRYQREAPHLRPAR